MPTIDVSALSERRKADRRRMADIVEALLKREGVQYERLEGINWVPGSIRIELKINDLRLGVEFDRDSPRPDVYLLPWNIVPGRTTCLSDRLGCVNLNHFQKATRIVRGFPSLLAAIADGIAAAKDGSAFSPEREAEYRHKKESGQLLWQRIATAQAEGNLGALPH